MEARFADGNRRHGAVIAAWDGLLFARQRFRPRRHWHFVWGVKKAIAAGDDKLLVRLSRQGLVWAQQIGATPAARAQMNTTQ